MATTVIDPTDGSSYDIVSVGRYWDVVESSNGDRPEGLHDQGPWASLEQALAALRAFCQKKEAQTGVLSRPSVHADDR